MFDCACSLAEIRRITRREVEEIVRLAEGKGKVIGVRLAPEDPVNADSAQHWLPIPSCKRHVILRRLTCYVMRSTLEA